MPELVKLNLLVNTGSSQITIKMTADFRTLILQRLKARDRECAQFSRIFASCKSKELKTIQSLHILSDDALAESVNHLVAKNNRLLSRKRSTTAASGSGTADGEAGEEEVDALRVELADVYKKKAINDQLLIDANGKLAELEKRLAKVTEE